MQIVLGSRSARSETIFLKSLFLNHFGNENALPIHLHFLTDAASLFILDGILTSWGIEKVRTTFYSVEEYQVGLKEVNSERNISQFLNWKEYKMTKLLGIIL